MTHRVSLYCAVFNYPEIESAILLHGYTGAIDLVRNDVTEVLDSGRQVDQLPYALRRTLIDRGHLTKKSAREEGDHVLNVLEVLRRKLEARTSFVIEPVFPPGTSPEDGRRILGSYFEIMDGLKSSSSYREATIELRNGFSSCSSEFLESAISARNDWTLSAMIDGRDFASLGRYADQHKIKESFVFSEFEQDGFDEALKALVEDFAAALSRDAIIVWLVSPTVGNESLEKIVRHAFDLRARFPFGFSFAFLADSPEIERQRGLNVSGGRYFTALKPSEVLLYRRIKRFFENPTLLINFEPCFYRGDLTVRFSDGRIFLSYGSEREVEAGDCRSAPVRVDYERIEAAKASLGFSDIDKELVGCPFCLICGCSAAGDQADQTSDQKCSGFGEDLERILPPLFYNA